MRLCSILRFHKWLLCNSIAHPIKKMRVIAPAYYFSRRQAYKEGVYMHATTPDPILTSSNLSLLVCYYLFSRVRRDCRYTKRWGEWSDWVLCSASLANNQSDKHTLIWKYKCITTTSSAQYKCVKCTKMRKVHRCTHGVCRVAHKHNDICTNQRPLTRPVLTLVRGCPSHWTRTRYWATRLVWLYPMSRPVFIFDLIGIRN